MLRTAILAYGALAILVGILLAAAGIGFPIVFYVLGQGVIVIAALLFERGRYQPPASGSSGWQDTEERFVDPTSGQLMKVRYNPRTGAREYVPVQPPQGSTLPEGGGSKRL